MFSGGFSPLHWIIVLVIVLAIFGTKKLRNVGSDLGAAVKGFKDGMNGADDKKASEQAPQQVAQQAPNTQKDSKADSNTVDVNAKDVH